MNNIERILKFSIPISSYSRQGDDGQWFDVWFKETLQKVDRPSSMNLAKPWMLKVNNVSQRKTKSKYFEKIHTYYLVLCVVIVRRSSAKYGLGSSNSWTPSKGPNSNRIRWRPGFDLSVLRISEISRFSSWHFFLFCVQWYINHLSSIPLIRFVSQSSLTKKPIDFLYEIENNENVDQAITKDQSHQTITKSANEQKFIVVLYCLQ